jgi:hypothetical protein
MLVADFSQEKIKYWQPIHVPLGVDSAWQNRGA